MRYPENLIWPGKRKSLVVRALLVLLVLLVVVVVVVVLLVLLGLPRDSRGWRERRWALGAAVLVFMGFTLGCVCQH